MWPFVERWQSDKGFKGTVVNMALLSLYGGSLEIMVSVPLTCVNDANDFRLILQRDKNN